MCVCVYFFWHTITAHSFFLACPNLNLSSSTFTHHTIFFLASNSWQQQQQQTICISLSLRHQGFSALLLWKRPVAARISFMDVVRRYERSKKDRILHEERGERDVSISTVLKSYLLQIHRCVCVS